MESLAKGVLINSLMESHRINRGKQQIPEIGEIVLVVGKQKNGGE